jgi:hypothetical protein
VRRRKVQKAVIFCLCLPVQWLLRLYPAEEKAGGTEETKPAAKMKAK